jgi:hypothetical protein
MNEIKPPQKWAMDLARDLCLGMGPEGTVYFEQGISRVAATLENIQELAWQNAYRNGYEDALPTRLQVND